MDNGTDPDRSFRGLWRWATTPPRVYVTYLILLILVWAVSFYAGTLSPRRTANPIAPPVSTPQR